VPNLAPGGRQGVLQLLLTVTEIRKIQQLAHG
jgi:hypothetical protein